MAPTSEGTKRIGKWQLGSLLGQGSYGSVYEATNDKGEVAAIKVHDKEALTAAMLEVARNEAKILQALEFPNIIELFETIETEKEFCLVLQYAAGGDLLSYLRKHGMMMENEARFMFRQIARAVEYCHKNGIINRDLKLENILLDDKQQAVYITDWGFAGHWSPGVQQSEFMGSMHYMSPQMIQGKPYVGPEVDIWSLGVILYAMVTAKLPFNSSVSAMLEAKIVTGSYDIPSHLSAECVSLIKAMLHPDPQQRITISKVKEHPWLVRPRSLSR